MNTRILRMTSRENLQWIMEDFCLNTNDFEYLKNMFEDDFDGETLRTAKKQIIKDIFANKEQINGYIKNLESDINLENKSKFADFQFIEEMQNLVFFSKIYIKENF